MVKPKLNGQKGNIIMIVDKDRERKLKKLDKIIAAIQRDDERGNQLFSYYHPYRRRHYAYFKTLRTAKSIARSEGCMGFADGTVADDPLDFKNFGKVQLHLIIESLICHRNPLGLDTDDFFIMGHAFIYKYPYKWLQDIEDLFSYRDSDNQLCRSEMLFPDEKKLIYGPTIRASDWADPELPS